MLAREKPHCGISGVPFMKSTTGADATALSMAALVSLDSSRVCRAAKREERRGLWRGRREERKTWECNVSVVSLGGRNVRCTHRSKG